ncbi:MAG: tetratricopeptide repeat protein [Bacteroidota bacterium]
MTKKASLNSKKRVIPPGVGQKEHGRGFVAKNREVILLAVVVLVTLFTYLPILHHRFTNWDDNDYVTENSFIRTLSAANLEHVFTKPVALNYHPLTIISLAVNYRLSGTNPLSYFLVNLLLHLLNTVLVYYFSLLVLDRNKALALFVAAIFAVHPMHVESVAWISERKDVLYTLFFIAAMIAWVFFIAKGRWPWYLCSFVLFGFAALSKPSSVVFPMILFAIDYVSKRKSSLRLVVEKIPFLAVSVVIGMATLHAQLGKSVVDIRYFNLAQQLLFASYGFFFYIWKLIIPTGLSALHPVPAFNTSLDLPLIYYIAPVINLLIIGFAWFSLKYTRLLVFGLVFYLLNIVLTLQVVQVGSAVVAERYTYIAYLGLLVGLAWLIKEVASRFKIPVRLIYTAMGLFFVVCTALAMQRVPVWENSESLWSDVLSRYPESATAYNNRGYYFAEEKQYDKALPDFTRAIELRPAFVDALNNRATLYRLENLHRLAVADYTKALVLDSNYIKALSGRGSAYAALGVLDSALGDFNMAIRLNPVLADALGDRGEVYFRLGQFDNAIDDCSRKIAIYPDNTASYLNRGVAYSSLGKWEQAIHDYSFVLKTSSDNPSVYEWRGVAFKNTGSFQRAIDDFTAAIRLNPQKPTLYLNRAEAWIKSGHPQNGNEDIEHARKLGADIPVQSSSGALPGRGN